MTSTVRKLPGLQRVPHKSRQTTESSSLRPGMSRQNTQILTGMSPEAHAAMLLTREDTRDNLRSRPASLPRLAASNNNDNNTNNNKSASKNNNNKPSNTPRNNENSNIKKTSPSSATNKNATLDNSTAQYRLSPLSRHKLLPSAATSRDRSSNTRTDPTIISEFNDSGFGSVKHQSRDIETATTSAVAASTTSNKDTADSNNNNTTSFTTGARRHLQHRPLSRLSRSQSAKRNNSNCRAREDRDDFDDEDVGVDDDDNGFDDEYFGGQTLTGVDDTGENGALTNTLTDRNASRSFVLALDAALEANCVQRLRGDITDVEGGSGAPGTVRALNGGRLSNAQEVVVNVCHGECEKELVFHDDDDDALDTARAASEIRVHTWLEYNQGFPPDDIGENEFNFEAREPHADIPPRPSLSSSTTTLTQSKSTNVKATLRVPTARARSGVKQSVTTKTHTVTTASSRADKPPVAARRDNNNNNSAGSRRSKSGTNGSARDNSSSSRFGSALSNDGSSKRSPNSSATKRDTFLSRKAKGL